MTSIPVEQAGVVRTVVQRRTLLTLGPPGAALSYPFLLELFHLAVIRQGLGWRVLGSLFLSAAIAAPFAGIYAFWKLGSGENLTPAEARAKGLALLSIAAPPLYTTLGVVLAILHSAASDLLVWVIFWVAASALLLWERRTTALEATTPRPTFHSTLRYAHGVSAALIVCIFLAMHLLSHLGALSSLEAQQLLMSAFRHIYRAHLIEPLLVALMLFQMATGPVLLRQYIGTSVDSWRTLQVSSGAYLFFYIPGHMNSVFIYARAIAKIPTDWNFATGAPTGMLLDAWNIRLFPHYLLAVFFVMTHLALGARIVALANHVSVRTANRLAYAGIACGAILAVAILLGMVGVHFEH